MTKYKLKEHNCPIEGKMMCEVNAKCNWCGKFITARTNQTVRDSKGRYIKLTVLNKFKYFCNFFSLKIEEAVVE